MDSRWLSSHLVSASDVLQSVHPAHVNRTWTYCTHLNGAIINCATVNAS